MGLRIVEVAPQRQAKGVRVVESAAAAKPRDKTFQPVEDYAASVGAAFKAAGDEAVEYCRSGKGPIILEMQTYRSRGHSMSDPAKYRSKDEVQKMRSEHDPIEQVKARLLEQGWASEDELKAIDKDVRDIVADSADFAQNDPEPDASELYTDILL